MAKAIQVLLKKDAWEMKPVRSVEKIEKCRECPIPGWEEELPGWTGGLVLLFESWSFWLWSPGPGFGIGNPSCKKREDLFSFSFYLLHKKKLLM